MSNSSTIIFLALLILWLCYKLREKQKLIEMQKREISILKETSLSKQIEGTKDMINMQGKILQLCKDKMSLYQSHNYLENQKEDLAIHMTILDGIVRDTMAREKTIQTTISSIIPHLDDQKQKQVMQELLALFPD